MERSEINPSIAQAFEIRSLQPGEAGQAAEIEQICFPPNEACSRQHMMERAALCPELFTVAIDRKTGLLAGFINGLAAEEPVFRDEFFIDPTLHCPEGKFIMILGLDVLPDFRRKGLGTELMRHFLEKARRNGRTAAILTCHDGKINMYAKMGFEDLGVSRSQWGGVPWHEMICRL